MALKQIVTVTGYCPKLDEEYEIDIIYTEVPVLGKTNTGYSKGSFSCDHSDQIRCSLDSQCPIYSSSPQIKY